jgi:hypothetical protein
MIFPVDKYEGKINNFYELMVQNKDIVDIKLSEDKWTLKEMVSHLVEEASISHQFYIRLQIDRRVKLPVYDSEIWQKITKIKGFNFLELINLWKSYNYFLIYLIQQIDEKDLDNMGEGEGMEFSLKYCIEEYFIRQMDFHIELYKKRIEETNGKE